MCFIRGDFVKRKRGYAKVSERYFETVNPDPTRQEVEVVLGDFAQKSGNHHMR